MKAVAGYWSMTGTAIFPQLSPAMPLESWTCVARDLGSQAQVDVHLLSAWRMINQHDNVTIRKSMGIKMYYLGSSLIITPKNVGN